MQLSASSVGMVIAYYFNVLGYWTPGGMRITSATSNEEF